MWPFVPTASVARVQRMEFPTWEELQEDAPAQAVVGMAFVCVGLVLFMARGQLRAWLDELPGGRVVSFVYPLNGFPSRAGAVIERMA